MSFRASRQLGGLLDGQPRAASRVGRRTGVLLDLPPLEQRCRVGVVVNGQPRHVSLVDLPQHHSLAVRVDAAGDGAHLRSVLTRRVPYASAPPSTSRTVLTRSRLARRTRSGTLSPSRRCRPTAPRAGWGYPWTAGHSSASPPDRAHARGASTARTHPTAGRAVAAPRRRVRRAQLPVARTPRSRSRTRARRRGSPGPPGRPARRRPRRGGQDAWAAGRRSSERATQGERLCHSFPTTSATRCEAHPDVRDRARLHVPERHSYATQRQRG